MTEIFTRTTSMAPVSTSGLMAESTKENGSTIKWKARGHSHGAMGDAMLVSTRMIKNMVKERLSGQMAESTLDNGIKESNTAKAPTLRKERRDKASGKWAKELNGSKARNEL